jgi:peptidyl-prolyl cis-trans isomerase D
VRWAYSAKKDDISKVFTFGNKYAIAHLTEIREKGFLPLETVKDQVTAEVRKEKKAEKMIEKFKSAGATSIDAIGQKLNTPATDADNVTMANSYIPGIGNEPAVVGTVFALKPNKVSDPIKGDNGVSVVMVKSFKDVPANADVTSNKKQVGEQRKGRADYEVFNALKEKAGVEDNRGRFF